MTKYLKVVISVLIIMSLSMNNSWGMKFEHLTSEDGLSIGFVSDIVKDHQGFMWFAGSDGLARFDGHSYRIYKHDADDPNSIPENLVWKLALDGRDSLWVLTSSSIARFDLIREKFERILSLPGTSELASSDLIVDIRGELWTSIDNEIYKYDEKLNKFVSMIKIDGPSRVDKFIFANDGNIWFATNLNGLSKRNKVSGEIHTFAFPQEVIKRLDWLGVQAIFESLDGLLYIGFGEGLTIFNSREGAFVDDSSYHDRHGYTKSNITDIIGSQDGNIFFATDGNGLGVLDVKRKTFERYAHDGFYRDSLSSNVVKSLFVEPSGDLWLGMYPSGVDYSNRLSSSFNNYKHHPLNKYSLSSNDVGTVAEDRLGNLWLGTSKGLNYFNRNNSSFINLNNDAEWEGALLDKSIVKVLYDSKNRLWASVWGEGVFMIDLISFQTKHFEPTPNCSDCIAGGTVWDILEDSQGSIWFGTVGGLSRYVESGEFFSNFLLSSSFQGSYIWTIEEDANGFIWVGTIDGVKKFDKYKQSYTNYTSMDFSNGLLSNIVYSIHEDVNRNLWIGTASGLNIFDMNSGSFRRLDKEHDLLSQKIHAIVSDENGDIWVSGLNGVLRFSPDFKVMQAFNKSSGLQGDEFSFGALTLSSGELVFCGRDGFTIIGGEHEIERNTTVPTPMLTRLNVLNKPVEVNAPESPLVKLINFSDTIRLQPHQNIISLEYSALSYRNGLKNTYKYMLKGFDDNWQYVGNRRSATYTNLKPDTYEFLLMAANDEGVWSPEKSMLQIVIIPPWWRTWWAYFLYVFMALSLLYWFVHTQRQKVTLIKEKLAHERLKHTQSEMLQNKSMEGLSLLVAGVAHEINNPNNFAYTSVYNLEADLIKFKHKLFDAADDDADEDILAEFDKDFVELFKTLASMKNGTARIKDIVDSLRVFSSTDQAERKDVDLVHDLKLVAELLMPAYEVNVKFEIDVPAKLSLYGNPVELNQLFVNMITNACQAIEAKQLKEGKGIVAIKMFKEAGSVKIVIRDTGCGMSSETLEHLFKPFYTTRAVGDGAGLGLSMAYGIVDKHGGKIEVESVEGEGSCFTVSLPEEGMEKLTTLFV